MKNKLLFLILGIVNFPVFSQCISGDCYNNYGVKKFSVGIFSGYFKDGYITNGEFKYDSGATYRGDFVSGSKQGYGTMRFDDGSTYEGDWVNDTKTGKGISKWLNGASYNGDWVSDIRQGYGTMRYDDGSTYEGDWVNDKKSGKGISKWLNGASYNGDWVSDIRQGYGTMRYDDGSIYEGDWVSDVIQGQGKLTYISGIIKEGKWVNNQFISTNSISTKENNYDNNTEYVNNNINQQSNSQNITTSNSYQTVNIGSQVWSKKNLDVSTFRNGDPILYVTNMEDWKNAGYYNGSKTPAWCYYDFDPSNNVKYGKLYNWYAVIDSRGLAPEGWHIPSNVEWDALINYLGNDVRKKLKNTSGWDEYKTGGRGYKECPNCKDWNSEYRRKIPCHICKDSREIETFTQEIYHSGNGNNSSGFSALPGGKTEGSYIQFIDKGKMGRWWSSTGKIYDYSASCFELESIEYSSLKNFFSIGEAKTWQGLSVRLIRD